MTMEHVAGVTSSLSRMFLIEMTQDTVDNDRLKRYQEKIEILPMHIYDFLAWVTANFESIRQSISLAFPNKRKEYQFAFPRYSEIEYVREIL